MNARQAGPTSETGVAIQAAVSVLAAAAVAYAYRYRRHHDPQLLMALFFACSIGALPYVLSYDTLPLCFAAVVLLATGKLNAGGRRLVQLVYWLPLIQIGLGTLQIPGPALIAPAFAGYLFMQLKPFSAGQAAKPA